MQYGSWLYDWTRRTEKTLDQHDRDIRDTKQATEKHNDRLKALEDAWQYAKIMGKVGLVLVILALNLGRETTIELIKGLLSSGLVK